MGNVVKEVACMIGCIYLALRLGYVLTAVIEGIGRWHVRGGETIAIGQSGHARQGMAGNRKAATLGREALS